MYRIVLKADSKTCCWFVSVLRCHCLLWAGTLVVIIKHTALGWLLGSTSQLLEPSCFGSEVEELLGLDHCGTPCVQSSANLSFAGFQVLDRWVPEAFYFIAVTANLGIALLVCCTSYDSVCQSIYTVQIQNLALLYNSVNITLLYSKHYNKLRQWKRGIVLWRRK